MELRDCAYGSALESHGGDYVVCSPQVPNADNKYSTGYPAPSLFRSYSLNCIPYYTVMNNPWPIRPGTPLSDTPESDLASLSPRTALLSPPYMNAELTRPRRISRGPNDKFRHERERAHANSTNRDLVRLLIDEEYESRQTRKLLYTALDRLESETRRADEAENQLSGTMERMRSINEARVAAQQEAVRAQEELRLYKLQLNNAQGEIIRAQEVLRVIEAQRDDAETAAAEARSKARRLNEERLIEMAKEEGRRLGYEEGIRRGRNIGYTEGRITGLDDGRSRMRRAAAPTPDQMLDTQDEEQPSVTLPLEPEPIPDSRAPPEILRVQSSVRTSLDGRRGSRSRHDSESETASRTGAPRHRDPIVMPVMVEHPEPVSRNPTLTTQSSRSLQQPEPWPMPNRSSARSPSTRPSSVQNSVPSVHHSDFHIPPDNYIPTLDQDQRISLPPPHELHREISSPSQPVAGPSSDSTRTYGYPPRRASPESIASTKISQSQSSSISALEIIGLPNVTHRDRRREPNSLSVIHEDASVVADYETVTGSDTGGRHYRSERDNDSHATRQSRRDTSNQRLADELRWSNPSEVEEWRRYGTEKTQERNSRGPPRSRPSSVTTPNPLSPPNWNGTNGPLPQHHRHSRSVSTPTERDSAHYDHRRVVSSDSSVPDITIQPPSNPPSDVPSRRTSVISGLLSPDHANQPLPVPAPAHAPLTNTAYTGQFYPTGNGNYSAPPPGDPVIPNMSGRDTPSQQRSSSIYAPTQPDSRSPQPYVTAPVPSDVIYPPPPISRDPTPNATENRGNRSAHNRRESLSEMAGMTPAARTLSLHSGGAESSHGSQKHRSNAPRNSRQSYAHYDPNVYNDPAYLSSNESLLDPRTDANTAVNAGGSRRSSRMPTTSPSPSYGTRGTPN